MTDKLKENIKQVLKKDGYLRKQNQVFPTINKMDRSYFIDYEKSMHIGEDGLYRWASTTVGEYRRELEKIGEEDEDVLDFIIPVLEGISNYDNDNIREQAVSLYNYMM